MLRASPRSSALPLLYVLGGFVVGCTLGCDLALPPFPKLGFRSLHAATTSGSSCGKALVACVRCGVLESSWMSQMRRGPEDIENAFAAAEERLAQTWETLAELRERLEIELEVPSSLLH